MENRRAPWRIAIADDSPAFLAAAAGYIGSLPGCVLAGTAASALEALALVEAVTPDLLLLDLGIAPARGLDMVRRGEGSPPAAPPPPPPPPLFSPGGGAGPTAGAPRHRRARVFLWRGGGGASRRRGRRGAARQGSIRHRPGRVAAAPAPNVLAKLAFKAPREQSHFLFRLAVAFLACRLDAAAIRLERFRRQGALLQRLCQRLPRRRVGRIARHCFAQLRHGARQVARLHVLDAERIAQQRSVARGTDQLFEGFDRRHANALS